MIGVSLRKSRLFWGPLLIDVCNVLQSKAEYKRANPESYWCTTCILWAHIKPTVRTEAQPWRALMWGCNWHTNERAIAQRGTSRCVAAVGQSKYQRGRQWRRGTKCCFRPLKVKASQPRIHPKYWWLKLTLWIITLLHFLLILAWISSVVNVPVCVRPLPQSEPSVRLSWLVYYTPAGMSSHWHWHSVPWVQCAETHSKPHKQWRWQPPGKKECRWVSVRVAPAEPSATTSACVLFHKKKIFALFPRPFTHVVVGASVPEIFQIIKQTLMSEMTTRVNTECSFLMIIISIS